MGEGKGRQTRAQSHSKGMGTNSRTEFDGKVVLKVSQCYSGGLLVSTSATSALSY